MLTAFCHPLQVPFSSQRSGPRLHLLPLWLFPLTGSMAAEFFALMNDSSIPDNIREALASYDTPLFARSCNDQEELASLISHLMDASDTSSVGDQILARASIRLLFSRCRESCGLPPLDDTKVSQQPNGTASPAASSPAPNAGASWQESWPAKLSAERTAELRKRFEDDYPTELLDSDCFPSSRLLALTSKMVADKEIRWLPWKFRLSAKAQDDNLLIRPKKLPRLSELSDLSWTRRPHGTFMTAQHLSISSTSCLLWPPTVLHYVVGHTWARLSSTRRSFSSSASQSTSQLPIFEVPLLSKPKRPTREHGSLSANL